MTAALAMIAKPFIVIAFIVFVRFINSIVYFALPKKVSEFLLKKR